MINIDEEMLFHLQVK